MHQGVEIEYLCFQFVINKRHKCSFTVTLLFLWITIYTVIVNTGKFPTEFRDETTLTWGEKNGPFFVQILGETNFERTEKWDGDLVTKQVEKVHGGLLVVWFGFLLWCCVKWHLKRKWPRETPHSDYFKNEKLTTGGEEMRVVTNWTSTSQGAERKEGKRWGTCDEQIKVGSRRSTSTVREKLNCPAVKTCLT